MFTSSFDFRFINVQERTASGLKCTFYNYSFVGDSHRRYIVTGEEYQENVIAVKFCLQAHKEQSNRFNRLTGLNEASRVITTVGKIIVDILKRKPEASFVFIGITLPNEAPGSTKRHRLYSKILYNIMSPVLFEHYTEPAQDAYILRNRKSNDQNLLNTIKEGIKELLAD